MTPSQPDEATLHDLIGLIYEATADPARWPGFLEAFSDTAVSEHPEYHRLLLPHLRRAREMQRRLARQSFGRYGALEALDGLADGVMVFDGTGCICYANQAAEQLLAASQGLRRDEAGSVRALLQGQNEKLYRMIGQAAAGARKLEDRGCLRVCRPQGQPLALLVAPLRDNDALPGAPKAGALVFIHDPEATPAPLVDTARWHFDLTPAQARLAAALAIGDSLAEFAEAMAISVATARTHLKEIFAKTGARRQADLVHLLLSSPSFHARGDGLSDRTGSEARRHTLETAFGSPLP